MTAPNLGNNDTDGPLKEVFKKDLHGYKFIGKTTADNLKLFLDVVKEVQKQPGAENEKVVPNPTLDEFLSLLGGTVDSEFLHREVLTDIFKELISGHSVETRRIGKGIAPISGRDGKLVYLVKRFTGKGEIKVDEKGLADYSSLHLFDNIQKGQALVRVYPPKLGEPGKDVFGKVLQAPLGKPAQYKIDNTVEEKPDPAHSEYLVIYAAQNGYLYDDGSKLTVKNELAVSGNLDYHFGSLDFIGKVKITGDVMPGFNINAREGIEIKGSVRGGSLVSTHGAIIVDGFVFGGPKSRVISGEYFKARIVQEVNAEVRGDIIIVIESRDSILRSESVVKMEKASLVGGRILVVCGAEIFLFGSDVANQTIIEFCGDSQTTVAYSELKQRISNHEKAIDLLKLHLGPYAENPKKMQFLKLEHKSKMEDLYNKLGKLEKGKIQLVARQKTVAESAKVNSAKRVNILGKMFPGAEIQYKDKKFTTNDIIPGPASIDFIEADSVFAKAELKGLECTYKNEALDAKKEGDF
ncbi:MAG: FapA family protein [bacterium]|nr:FapA family protein [bacterium]